MSGDTTHQNPCCSVSSKRAGDQQGEGEVAGGAGGLGGVAGVGWNSIRKLTLQQSPGD